VLGKWGAWARWDRKLEVALGACCSHHHCRGNSWRLGLGTLGRISLVDSDLPATMQLLAIIYRKSREVPLLDDMAMEQGPYSSAFSRGNN
jgi:hypothetical protein